jgi:hypothetical protein
MTEMAAAGLERSVGATIATVSNKMDDVFSKEY